MIHGTNCLYYCEKRNQVYIFSGISVSSPIYLAPHIGIIDYVFLDNGDDVITVRYFEFKKMQFIGFLD